jgi:putative membrane-bound dehydrogenase-like protein
MLADRRLLIGLCLLGWQVSASGQAPTTTDSRLVIELVAREPDIVTPTGIAVDEAGQVWVIENNTHQRPPTYHGPASDRIRIFSDFDAAGVARKVHTFADGFRNAMAVALGQDGVVFLATRSDIYALRSEAGKEKIGERRVIVRLDTPGDYPHNGLSGFASDALGNLYFGLGENLGAAYRLIGADGTTFSGGGEGGSIYRCRPDGTGLVRVATGFWNPFHVAVDAFGRLFAVDNDPDERGPCRLLHIIPGGDYGYRFRNGRKGLHPFTAWNGELPGTLPMIAGTGEAPCGVLPYESTGLPAEYRGNLLVTSWGDHVVERYVLSPRGASFTSQAQPLVRGGEDFRPVGIATAPDGAIYMSDWVDKSYPVHGKGRVWRLRMRHPPTDDGLRPAQVRTVDVTRLRDLLRHPKEEIRRAAGAALARKGSESDPILAAVLRDEHDSRARVQALWSAARRHTPTTAEMLTLGLRDSAPEVRAEAARLLGETLSHDGARRDEARLVDVVRQDLSALVRMQALLQLRTPAVLAQVMPLLADDDPFLAGAALEVLGRRENVPVLLADASLQHHGTADARRRLGVLLALRRSGDSRGAAKLADFLADPDPAIRRAAIQWVGEERLAQWAGTLEAAAARPPVTRELFEALLAAKDFLAGTQHKPTDESSGQEYIAKVVRDPARPLAFRVLGLHMLRPDHPALSTDLLRRFLTDRSEELRREAVRTLAQRRDEPSQLVLRQLAGDPRADVPLRRWAIVGLAHSAVSSARTREVLIRLLGEPAFESDALRSVRGAAGAAGVDTALLARCAEAAASPAAQDQRELAEQLTLALAGQQSSQVGMQINELRRLAGARPAGEAAWRAFLARGGDPDAGERVFFHSRGPGCANCHRVDGRGALIGPDLSTVARASSRDKLIESILLPSKEIAPRFVTWVIATRDGKLHTGVIVEEGPNSTVTIGDAQGKLETISRNDIEERRALPTSIMPVNLPELMTPREFRDLIAYLCERK